MKCRFIPAARALGCALGRAVRDESGSGAVTAVFLLIAGIALAAFAVDATRVSSDGARLKQATDAAAQAVAMEAAKDSETDVAAMAERYVAVNLGLDREQLSRDLTVSVEPVTWKEYEGYRVKASFRALPSLLGGRGRTVEMSSAAVAIYNPLEVAFVVPSTMNESARDIEAIRDIGTDFYDELIDGRADRWMALVPYSDGVNVWDDKKGVARIRSWALPDRIEPTWFRYIKQDGGVSNMVSPRMPDVRKKILHVRRGMLAGEVFDWTKPPAQSFEISAQTCAGGNCIMSNFPGGWPYIEWRGPVIPSLGDGLSGPTDQRYIAADNTVPLTALLPLTDSREDFVARLDKMIPDHAEINHAMNMNIAMGWGAMALSPGFRGIDGWGDLDHPRDFSEDGKSTVKAIVMLANLNGNLLDIDMDSNNFYLDIAALGGKTEVNDDDFVRQRIEDLCDSFRKHQDFYFYMLLIPPSNYEAGKQRYDELSPTLLACGRNSGDVSELKTPSFADGKEAVIDRLNQIAADLENKSSYARLIE